MKQAPKNTVEFLNRIVGDKLEDIMIGAVCRIERFDASKMLADVQPMIRQEKQPGKVTDLPLLVNIRVGYQGAGDYVVRPPYKKGDLVWVSFATYDIYPGLKGKKADAEAGLFSLQSACVMCAVEQTGTILPLSISSKEGLLFAHKDGGAIQQVLPDKVVFHFGEDKTTIDSDGIKTTGKIDSDGEVTAYKATTPIGLKTHGHLTPTGPTLGKIPGGEA